MLIVITRKHQKRFDGSCFYELRKEATDFTHTYAITYKSIEYLRTWFMASDKP